MTVQERLFSADDLFALSQEGKRFELIKGHLIEMSPTGVTHGQLTSRIAALLDTFVEQHNLGQVLGAETGFKVRENPDTVLGIDAAFVSSARAQNRDDYFVGAPDLAVEVVSPGNTQTEMHEKVRAFFEAGSRLVWVIYPKSRAIYVYRTETDVHVLRESDSLEGGDVLPGFSVKISRIFSVLDK